MSASNVDKPGEGIANQISSPVIEAANHASETTQSKPAPTGHTSLQDDGSQQDVVLSPTSTPSFELPYLPAEILERIYFFAVENHAGITPAQLNFFLGPFGSQSYKSFPMPALLSINPTLRARMFKPWVRANLFRVNLWSINDRLGENITAYIRAKKLHMDFWKNIYNARIMIWTPTHFKLARPAPWDVATLNRCTNVRYLEVALNLDHCWKKDGPVSDQKFWTKSGRDFLDRTHLWNAIEHLHYLGIIRVCWSCSPPSIEEASVSGSLQHAEIMVEAVLESVRSILKAKGSKVQVEGMEESLLDMTCGRAACEERS